MDDVDRGLDVRAEQDARDRAQREPVHLADHVDDAVGRVPPALDRAVGLQCHRRGIGVHLPFREQRLDQTALAPVVGVLRGEQAVARGLPQLLVELVVLAEVGRLRGQDLLHALRGEDAVQHRTDSRWARRETHHVAVVPPGAEEELQRVAPEVECRAEQGEAFGPWYLSDGGHGSHHRAPVPRPVPLSALPERRPD